MANEIQVPDKPEASSSPVRETRLDKEQPKTLRDGIGLCLSGGGYRAMLFHLGSLWRLNELGYLGKLDRISSVSGGSLTAGVLGMLWKDIGVTAAQPAPGFPMVVDALRELAGHTIDIGSIWKGLLFPGSISDKIAAGYDTRLFHGKTLQDLPDHPRFVINATSLQTTVLFRFSKPFAADWRVGKIRNPRIPLAVAVAASSAFPPLLSPTELNFAKYGGSMEKTEGADLHCEPYTTHATLADGGVYDNLGLETVWKQYRTVLISDGGGHIAPQEAPAHNWPFQTIRVLDTIDNQVRSLRRRQSIDAFKSKQRLGTYWGIRTDIADYECDNALPCGLADTLQIAAVPTRLKKLPPETQEALINWGYAVCDAAMRKHLGATGPQPKFPYARGARL